MSIHRPEAFFGWEARCLAQLVGKHGHTVAALRRLISVAPEEEAILRAFALQHPEMAEHIDRALRYRIRVEEEFERLAPDSVG